ncbi:hypothetical protein [Aminobacter sp. BE322]|uniref:hypothetical protein n=1 Tax=unclassified Aminobacter TaxID=2644704 RepID=UPI003D21AD38
MTQLAVATKIGGNPVAEVLDEGELFPCFAGTSLCADRPVEFGLATGNGRKHALDGLRVARLRHTRDLTLRLRLGAFPPLASIFHIGRRQPQCAEGRLLCFKQVTNLVGALDWQS